MSVNAVQVSEDTGVSDQYSGESERVETNGGVAGAGPGSDVTLPPLPGPAPAGLGPRRRCRGLPLARGAGRCGWS